MPTLTPTVISDFQEYFDKVHTRSSGENIWFRGVGKSTYELKPSIFRHPQITTTQHLFDFEEKLIARFNERSIPYLKERIDGKWELIFLMQHYGMPTRLLDWTENPFIALFFALSSAKKSPAGDYIDDAAVWIISPSKWNQFVLNQVSYSGGALSPSDRKVSGYAPEAPIDSMNEMPIALLGIHNSPRIVAQRGSFTLFGKSLNSMESMFTASSFPSDTLEKIVIPADKIKEFLEKLLRFGYSDSVVYPDLDGLSKEIKRNFGYEV